jgi:hypothetical protein
MNDRVEMRTVVIMRCNAIQQRGMHGVYIDAALRT